MIRIRRTKRTGKNGLKFPCKRAGITRLSKGKADYPPRGKLSYPERIKQNNSNRPSYIFRSGLGRKTKFVPGLTDYFNSNGAQSVK